MTIMLAGDSLSAGNLGVAFSRYLDVEGDMPLQIINEGLDGDTLIGVAGRLDGILMTTVPDVLVIEAGANDILLPAMKLRPDPWPAFAAGMENRGSRPIPDSAGFREAYEQLLTLAESRGVAKLVTVTIPVLGEDPDSPFAARRMELNSIIREVTMEYHGALADPAAVFDDFLDAIPDRSDWFFSHPDEFTADLRRIRRDRSAMPLSEERGLYLTMDGAHLNEKGAELMAGVISGALRGLE